MKERPILFSAPMIRALLAGTKTQTRRVLKHQPTARHQLYSVTHGGSMVVAAKWIPNTGDEGPSAVLCPYGVPGDRLWVRETTRMRLFNSMSDAQCAEYVADGAPVLEPHGFDYAWWYSRPTCPAIHLPRYASRITLEVTEVRVERLQDISEADAVAEGLRRTHDECAWHVEDDRHRAVDPRDSYASLWESINGAGSWDANPYVWAVSFHRTKT